MNSSVRWAFGFCVAASLIMVAVALHLWGAAEVRANAGNVFFLTFVGTVWLVFATKLFSWLGLSFRDDAVERDFASGLRMCGFLLAIGLVLGRAAAGDWHSESATVRDFIHDGWPATILWATALVIERLLRPGRRRPFPAWPSCGLLPALFFLALAAAWLWHLGAWEGMPK